MTTSRVEDQTLIIRIPSFSRPAFEDSALAALRGATGVKAVVLDLRGNHGGANPDKLLRALMERPFRTWMQETPANIGMFRSWGVLGRSPAMLITPEPNLPQKPIYTGPLFILVDGGCYSACESAVMPFADNHRATVIGERTAGSSGQTYVEDLGSGMAIGINVVRLRFPNGAAFEGVGIAPDVEVRTTLADIVAQRDPILARARAMISAGAGPAR